MQLICETLFPPRMFVAITFLTYSSYTSQSIAVVTPAIFIPVHKLAWAEAYIRTKWHLDASSRLATIEMGRKLGRGLRPLLGKGGAGTRLTQSRLGRGLPPCQVPASSIQPFGHNKHGSKIWGDVRCPFGGGGSWVPPHLTQSRMGEA